jgi:hypothetical protein
MFMAGNPDQTYEKSSDYRHLIPHQKTVVQKKMKPTDILGNDRKNKITLRFLLTAEEMSPTICSVVVA